MPSHKSPAFELTPAAYVWRGAGLDAVHAAAIAVVDSESHLTHALGDPARAFFSRSSIKPFQALPLVERGGLARFGFDRRQLALCCASHNGSDLQREVVASMLARLGLGPEALQCGSSMPLELRLHGRYPSAGEDRDPLRHNCSGKHAGFLALAKLLGQPLETYLQPDGPAQLAVRAAVAEVCETDEGALEVGIDGCSAPNFALSLSSLAVGFKNLALGRVAGLERPSLLGLRDAMLAEPLLISGEKRLDYDLARAFPGRVVNKGGAEGLLVLAFREPALGIAIKVLDGGQRALGAILIETLKQLGLLDRVELLPTLRRHEAPSVKNDRGLVTGEIRAEFQLRSL